MSTFELTECQQQVLESFQKFLCSSKTTFLIEGSAGSGKTTLVSYILKEYRLRAVGVAYTHKAKRVLQARMPNCRVFTLASIFAKLRAKTYVGAKAFNEGSENKFNEFVNHVFVLDEVSMVSDADYKRLKGAVQRIRGKILAIGDRYQIPAINQPLVEMDGVLCRKECAAFSEPFRGILDQIVRQSKASPILRVANFIRDNIDQDFSLKKLFPEFLIAAAEGYAAVAAALETGKEVKIIAYTNEAVQAHNFGVRVQMGRVAPFEVGDWLMGYQNIGYPELCVENGADYRVTKVTRETAAMRQGVVGWKVSCAGVAASFFFPDIDDPKNKPVFSRLTALARKVNEPRSTKKDYAIYRTLKDKLLMISDMYEFPESSGDFFSERELRAREPLLFTQVADVVDEKGGELVEKLSLLYGNIVERRLADDKALANGETFASAFCIFEKDLDYGYACTAHKSQGSTIDIVLIDEHNFDRMRDRMDTATGLLENKTKERNQLKYVACTRPSERLYILN